MYPQKGPKFFQPFWILIFTHDHFLFLLDGNLTWHIQPDSLSSCRGGGELGEMGKKCANVGVVVQKEEKDKILTCPDQHCPIELLVMEYSVSVLSNTYGY